VEAYARSIQLPTTSKHSCYISQEVYRDELEEITGWQDCLIQSGCERFIGRSGTIKEFHRTYNQFVSGVCLLHGEGGVGKTTFMVHTVLLPYSLKFIVLILVRNL